MLRTTALFLILSAPAFAEVPKVMTDIAPIQSLVARVMQGVGSPDVLLPPGASPHDFAMRPSDADRLAQADLIIWVGHGLTPWLEEPVETLAPDAAKLELLDTTGWAALPVRTDPEFAEEEHEEEGEEGHDHENSGADPHAWLDPSNAAVFMALIAQALATADPENATAYAANAAAAQVEMASLKAETLAALAPLAGATYIVPHDAYQYFETAFNMPAAGAISLTDASTPGPARVGELQAKVASGAVTCVLTDPQTSPEWTDVLREGSIARTAFVDPDGGSQAAGLETVAALYPAIIRQIAAGLVSCLE